MPNPSHIRLAATAEKLIALHGRSMQLVIDSDDGSGFDSYSGGKTYQDIVAVQTQFKADEVDGDLIRVNDLKLLVSANSEIDNTMSIKDESRTYSIKDAKLVKPGEVAMIYNVQARA